MPTTSFDSTTATSDSIVTSVPLVSSLKIHSAVMSVPDGERASVTLDGVKILATCGDLDFETLYPIESALGGSLEITSTGAVSFSAQIDEIITLANQTGLLVETLTNDFGITELNTPFLILSSNAGSTPVDMAGEVEPEPFGLMEAVGVDGSTDTIELYSVVGEDGTYYFRGIA